jgi:hypothetical protein
MLLGRLVFSLLSPQPKMLRLICGGNFPRTALGSWILWNQCNCCDFGGATTNLAGGLTLVGEERRLWMMAAA